MKTRSFEHSIPLGGAARPFDLSGVDGKRYSLDAFRDARILTVFFTCNHCPYVLGWESRIQDLCRRLGDRGVAFVGINSNDPVRYPQDGFEGMKERARAQKIPYPYLHDATQDVARAYGAQVTPEFFVFDRDRRLRFHGRLDDNHASPEAAGKRYLAPAIEALLGAREVPVPETDVEGCSIKWK
jgi:peroxiredoxin